MTSPSTAGGINGSAVNREGTRVILREITANLHNSPPAQSLRRKSGNEGSSIIGEQHDVKVRFIREFADVGTSGREANTESSLSSASSFQSLTSTLSSKCSSGICVDSSPARTSDTSYVSTDIPGLDDLISACENIRLTDTTLDLSKDQSFNLELEGEVLSGDQTFTSAIDKNSLDRTREISEANSPVNVPPDVNQDLNSTHIVDGDEETSAVNACFECATVDIVEASRFDQANSELGPVSETFVECYSNITQVNPALEVVELAKTDETHENLEILVNNKNADYLQVDNINNVANSTLSLDNFDGNSSATLEDLSNRIVDDATAQLREIESIGTIGRNDVVERPAQSVLNVTVDCSSDLKQFESTETTRRREVAETPVQSVLDVTVDFPCESKQFESSETTQRSGVVEKPVQSVLDVTVDFPSDLKQFQNTETTQRNEAAEEPAQTFLNVTVDFPSESKQFVSTETTQRSEVTEKPAQAVFDVTVDVPSNLNEIESVEAPQLSDVLENRVQSTLAITVDVPSSLKEITDIQPSNFEVNEQIQSKSLSDLVVDDISSVGSRECYKPSTPAFSDLDGNSQCPALPPFSSICSRAPLLETGIPLNEQAVEKVRSTEYTIPPVAVPTLSDKFANIAAINIAHSNSLLTIQEPSFLNAQKLVEDSTALVDNSSAVKIEKTVDPGLKIVQNVEKLIEPPEIEVGVFKKPLSPVQPGTTKSVPPELPKKESKESKLLSADSAKIKKHDFPEIDKTRGADSSTDLEDLDETVTIQDISAENIFAVEENDEYAEFLPKQQSTALTLEAPIVDSHKADLVASSGLISGDNLVPKPISLPDDYGAFVPQEQSTGLKAFADRPLQKLERQPTPFVTAPLPPIEAVFNAQNNKSPKPTLPDDDRCNFEKLELAAKAVANDIYNTSLEIEDDSCTRFVSGTSEIFHDPGGFDFLLSKTPQKNTRRDLRAESLYVNFDPLVSNISMLPQGIIQNTSPPVNAERNGDKNTTISNIGTPKRNPAIAAIDRLLFYSPMTTTTTPTTNTANIQKANDSPEKLEPTEETSAETVNMAKELELVRSAVIQLEEQLEKHRIDYEEALEKQSSYEEKINQLQTQLAQEIKNKNQITVVVDEYEKSISRLVSEKERDRKNLDFEKTKLLEELAAAKCHLDNSEAAFNDVHLKYERLKAVAAAYKSNEAALKQSAQKNVEIIKSLEFRNEQVKDHAAARLEKANQDLEAMLKQHESEKVRLHAMVKKAELKSKSLAELVEQKTKENKELTGILDEVIARVGRNKSE